MEVVRSDVESKAAAAGLPSSITPVIQRTRLRPWFIWVCSSILLWTCLVQLVAVGELWRLPFFGHVSNRISRVIVVDPLPLVLEDPRETPLLPSVPARNYTTNGFLKVSCNGGLNQMRAAICDMVTIARLLNLTLVVPELDKTSFWADPSDFEDIFDVGYFIASLRDEVRIIKRLPKRYSGKYGYKPLRMPPVSWSNEKYYLEQILPLFSKHKVLHFNKTDSRLANNGLSLDLQKLRCRVNFQALRFTPEIESLGNKLVHLLQAKGPFFALHLRYEMDMLAFSGCTHGCSAEEAEELKKLRGINEYVLLHWGYEYINRLECSGESSLGLRTMLDFAWYAFPWWREKEIMSEERRSQGLCPLTPEETSLVLRALGFDKDTQIYIASGEIYGSERRLAVLQAAFPRIVKKEVLLNQGELKSFQKHTSQMAALDFIVSVASDTFVPTYDGNMAKLVEGHRRYLGFKKTILLARRRLVELLNLHLNGTISWDVFQVAVRKAHEKKMGQPARRRVISDKPKEEDYFYANPQECLCEKPHCYNLLD